MSLCFYDENVLYFDSFEEYAVAFLRNQVPSATDYFLLEGPILLFNGYLRFGQNV